MTPVADGERGRCAPVRVWLRGNPADGKLCSANKVEGTLDRSEVDLGCRKRPIPWLRLPRSEARGSPSGNPSVTRKPICSTVCLVLLPHPSPGLALPLHRHSRPSSFACFQPPLPRTSLAAKGGHAPEFGNARDETEPA